MHPTLHQWNGNGVKMQAFRMPYAFSHHGIFDCQSERRINVKSYIIITSGNPCHFDRFEFTFKQDSNNHTNHSHPVQRKKSRKINIEKKTDASRNSGSFAQFPRFTSCTINASAAALCAFKRSASPNENFAQQRILFGYSSLIPIIKRTTFT